MVTKSSCEVTLGRTHVFQNGERQVLLGLHFFFARPYCLVQEIVVVEIVMRVTTLGCYRTAGSTQAVNIARPDGVRPKVLAAGPVWAPEVGCAARRQVCVHARQCLLMTRPCHLIHQTRIGSDDRAGQLIHSTESGQVLSGQSVQNIEREVRWTARRIILLRARHLLYVNKFIYLK